MISFSSFCDGNTKSCHKSQAVKSKLSIVTSNNITTSNDQSVKETRKQKGHREEAKRGGEEGKTKFEKKGGR